MIERIIDWSAKNRFIVLMVYVVVCGVGIYSLRNLPLDAIPDLSENQVIIYTEKMGMSPQVMEDQITYPIVSGLQGLAEVKAVRGFSMFGMSFVFAVFSDNTDLYFARSRVTEKLNLIKSQLPAGVTPVLGPDGTGVGHVYWYTLESKNHDLGTLRSIQDWYVRYKLSAVDGVAEVASIGGFVKQYQVDVDPLKMRAYGIGFDEISSAIRRNNNEVGGKLLEVNSAEYFVRGQGYYNSAEDIENSIIRTKAGIPLYVKNVANVSIGGDIRRGVLEKDGRGEVVGGIVVMRAGENANRVIERVKTKLEEIRQGLPKGVEIKAAYDRSTLISESVGTLNRALLEAAIVVSIVVALFLLHFRSIVRIIIELPVSVLISFILMYVFNITSNIMSLGGIILAVGVIVDSSIVMVENAYRNIAIAMRIRGPLSPQDYIDISISSAKQVGRAIFFSELIILVSFLPVFLLTGQEGKMFKPLAFTKSFAMLGSSIVVITLIPVLMTFLMRGKFREENANPVTRFFNNLYAPVLRFALKYKKSIIAINVLALLIAVPMALRTGSEFMPPLDEGSILYMPVTLPNVSINEITRIMTVQDKIIKSIPEVKEVLGKAGRAETATDNAPLNMIETIIQLKPKNEWRKGITKNDIIRELDSKLQIPGVRNGWTQPIINRINMLATGVRTDIGLKLYGSNIDTLEKLAIEAEQILKETEGTADVFAERVLNGYYLDIAPKEEALSRWGLKKSDVQDIIQTAIGGENIGTVFEGRMRFPVRARYQREERDNVESIKDLIVPINSTFAAQGMAAQSNTSDYSSSSSTEGDNGGMGSMSGGGSMSSSAQSGVSSSLISPNKSSTLEEKPKGGKIYLPLGRIADVKIATGPPMIASENGMPVSTVYLNARGKDMGSVVDAIKEALAKKLVLSAGYSYTFSGQYENKIRAQRTIEFIMPVVFLLIFFMLFFTFKDYLEAGVVMLSVPFALIGGMYMIYALGYNFSVAVWVGFIALYGLAVETGVVMVIYLHEALDKRIKEYRAGNRESITSQDIYEATLEGAILRLRPKIMTVLTSMVGLIPVMWATGTGADVMKPLTAPLIGGLITSAIHVLIVTPILFVLMKERALKKGTLDVSKMHSEVK